MSPYTIVHTDQSIIDLIEVGNFIALDNPVRAESFIAEITAFIDEVLSLFPYSTSTNFPAYPAVRMIPYRKYNIYYQVLENDKSVEILHIYNSSKNSNY